MNDVLSVADRIVSSLKAIKPETKSLKIRCPESLAEFSILIKPGLLRKTFYSKFKFPTEHVTKVDLHSLRTFKDENQALVRTANDCIIDLGQLDKESDSALLTIEYAIDSPDVVNTLVSRRWQEDSTGAGDEDSYWMHAGLKQYAALETEYGQLDLTDVDVSVDVGIYEKLKAALPRQFLARTQELARVVYETDRNKRMKQMMHYLYLRNVKGGSDDYSKIAELQTLFTTHNFRKFVDVEKPFIYDAARPGRMGIGDAYGIPKFVVVVSRTDLSLKRPTADGHLYYKSKSLKDELDELFG